MHRIQLPLVLVFVAVAAFAARSRSLFVDEGDTWATTATGGRFFLAAITDWDGHAPLYYSALVPIVQVGQSELALRALSIAMAAATIVAVRQLARRWFDAPTGLVAMVVVASSATVVHFSTEARNYALTILLASVATERLLVAVRRRSVGAWAGYAVAASLLVLSHVLATVLVAGHAAAYLVALVRERRRPEPGALVAGAVVAAVLVGFSLVARGSSSSVDGLPPFSVRHVATGLRDLVGYRSAVPLLPFAALGLLGALRWRGRSPEGVDRLSFVALAGVPVALLVAASGSGSLLNGRYLTPLVPLLVLAVSHGVTSLPATKLAAALVAVALAASLWATASTLLDVTEDFEAAMGEVVDGSAPGDGIVYFDAYSSSVGAYYLREEARADRPVPLVPERAYPSDLRLDEPLIPAAELEAAAADGPARIWLVVRDSEASALPDAYREVRSILDDARYVPVRTDRFRGVTLVELRR